MTYLLFYPFGIDVIMLLLFWHMDSTWH